MGNVSIWYSVLAVVVLMPFSNCAPGKPMKSVFQEMSITEKVLDVLSADRFTVEYVRFGGSQPNVIYTATFNKTLGIVNVDHQRLSANGATVTDLCSVISQGMEMDTFKANLDALALTDQGGPAVQAAGDSWLVFIGRNGESFRLFFEGSANSVQGKTVISGGQLVTEQFVLRGTCPQ